MADDGGHPERGVDAPYPRCPLEAGSRRRQAGHHRVRPQLAEGQAQPTVHVEQVRRGHERRETRGQLRGEQALEGERDLHHAPPQTRPAARGHRVHPRVQGEVRGDQ